ncbi:sperm-tail PG-rich repeat-containing protein 2-like [Tribolium madens]|uniref:sperm-tail PG-rich repeat-containing protein 2-like n=1 Tax=Tribolium madens TaxID=41895 RepID=UPI001CF7361A|nr:sperm-tail PG-rich repeat-containing protein 2-like [Tribolium madens]
MYDVSSRTVLIKSSTGENVGPSTYVTCEPRCRKQNYAPFLSNTIKSPSFISKLNTNAIYDIRDYRTKIKGGSSIKNRAPRFVYKADDTPAPTKYNPKPIQCGKKKLKLDPTKPKVYVCAVPYSSTVTAPSIPSKVDENGYEIDEEGKIVKVPPDEKIPVDLEIKSQFGVGKGWRWACRTSERFDDKKYTTAGPGPAAYSVEIPKCRKAEEDEKYREMARLFTFIPRYVEAQEMKAQREKMPGPGSYDLGTSKKECESINPRPFISATARFSYKISDTPAPTQYTVCDCSTKQKQFSTKCAPFEVESPRFKRKKLACTPGPACYNLKGALQQKIESKKNRFAICDPPFNTTAPRKISFAPRDAAYTPSAADYPEDQDEEYDDTTEIYSSVFKNCVERFSCLKDGKDSIGPAEYNIRESFAKSRNRKCHSVAEVPFNSSGPRSVTPAVKTGVPCPSSYKTERGLDYTSCRFAMSPRFKCVEETPGPGLYNIHPRLEKSTYKAYDTHNLKLKENVLRKKLRTAPWDTRKHWCSVLKKQRLLNWFNVELDFEERMILLIQKLFDKPI